MDINKNQQVNTFLKGMNTDISDSLIDTSQYRYAENLQLTTNTEHNTGELRLVEGNVQIKEFTGQRIIYINSIRDYIVVITATTTSWSIYVNDNKGIGDWTLLFGPCTDLLWDSLDTVAISGVMRYESDNNIKLYIVDNTGRHVIIPIQIDKSHRESIPPTEIKTLTGYQDVFLSPPVATLSTESGYLKPAKVQYVYRLYKLGRAATTLSPAGNVISLYKNSSEGYNSSQITDKAVSIRISFDDIQNLDRIQLFRITYSYNGQSPTIYRIEDKMIDPSNGFIEIIDYGDNKEQLGIDELLSMTQMQIRPKLIESKGDTLFAANIKYVQDDVDNDFSNYDTRSFSSGNYWKLPNGDEQDILFGANGSPIKPQKGSELYHRQFNTSDYSYNEQYWKPFAETGSGFDAGIGGKGENINWRLTTKQVAVSNIGRDITEQRNFYKCDETYRFGVILYNVKGQASSVKWICDIRIPPRSKDDYNFTGEGNCTINMYEPVFFIKKWPVGCKAIQIVQCPRKTSDRHVITQGIVGATMRMYTYDDQNNFIRTNYICPSGLMTLQQTTSDDLSGENSLKRFSKSSYDVLQFSSPEYVYQSDDIKNILNSYQESTSIEHVCAFDIYCNRDTPSYVQGVYGYQTKTSANTIQNRCIGNPFDIISVPNQPNNDRYGIIDINPHGSIAVLDDINNWYSRNNQTLLRLVLNNANHDDSWEWGYVGFNHVIPKSVLASEDAIPTYSSIKSFAYPSVPAWNKFANGENIRFQDDVTAIDSDSYINWTYPLCLDSNTGNDSNMAKCLKRISYIDIEEGWKRFLTVLGTGGKCILIKLQNGLSFNQQLNIHPNYDPESYGGPGGFDQYLHPLNGNGIFAPIHIANIVKHCTPYGGYNKEAIQNSTYYGHGNVITEEYFNSFTGSDVCNVEAKGGDSYISFFKYNAAHIWYDPIYITAAKQSTVYEVPIETDIDLDADCGTKYKSSTNLGYYIQDEIVSFPSKTGGYSQDKPAYQYNTAYNQEPNVITYSSIENTDISNYNWDTRIHNSELKTNGESIDSWLTFKALNYLDVDSRHGEITDLKLFKDRLIFWQDDAVGILSSNERTMLNDTSGNQIILGNGGILQRSDYISTTYGMKKDQFVSTQSNTTLYWWDGNNKEILAYGDNGLLPLGSLKAVRNYLNQYSENTHPYMFYDIKNKEVVSSVVNNESLVYSEQIEAFSSVYKFMPLYGTELADQILTTDNTTIYKQNVTENGVSELFGQPMLPKLQYVINAQNMFPKVFDIQTFGGRFYGGDNITDLQFDYKTPLKQQSSCTGSSVTNREYDFRLDIPRNNNDPYGGRMRGKTMECELSSTSNSTDFSLQYIVTKYRMSWS